MIFVSFVSLMVATQIFVRLISVVPWYQILLFFLLVLLPGLNLGYLILNVIWEFFALFLPNAIRLNLPVSWVYALRYEEGFSDTMINIFGTKKWDELIETVKNKIESENKEKQNHVE